jgi:hypothetical protein
MSNDPASGPPGAKPAARPENTRFTPESDAPPAETAYPPPKPGPFLWCSDCRSAMRTYYYALDTRPLCAKCKTPYAAQAARGSGPGALRRVILQGGGAALGCALLLGLFVMMFGFMRVIAAVGIGYAVGRAVNHASGSFYDTRFRVIAAVFTYFAIGLGSLAPVIKGIATAPDTPFVLAAEEAPEDANAAAVQREAELEAMDLDELTTQMENEREAKLAANKVMAGVDRDALRESQELKAKPFFSLMGTMLILLLTLPLLANFAYGLYAGVIGGMAIGYGVYKAWDMTGHTVGLYITGPHRVGTGPVSHTNG